MAEEGLILALMAVMIVAPTAPGGGISGAYNTLSSRHLTAAANHMLCLL